MSKLLCQAQQKGSAGLYMVVDWTGTTWVGPGGHHRGTWMGCSAWLQLATWQVEWTPDPPQLIFVLFVDPAVGLRKGVVEETAPTIPV